MARAEKAFTSSTFTVSTSETADMAASPTWATMMESARPTVMARSCSMTRGMIRFRRSLLVKSMLTVFSCVNNPSFLSHWNSLGLMLKVA